MGNKVFGAALTFVLAWLTIPPLTSNAAEITPNPQLSQLLSDAKSLVSLLKSDIASLDFFTLSGEGSQAHAVMLKLYAERIAAVRSQAAKLDAMRKDGSRAQQTAVDHIVPVMNELASTAEAAIRSAARARLSGTEYRQYLKLSSDLAGEQSTVIAAWIDYAKTRGELDSLAEKMGAPSGAP